MRRHIPRRHWRRPLAVALALLGSIWAAPASAINSGDLAAFLDGFIEARMAEHRVVGTTVAVVHNGRILFAKGYGHANLEESVPVRADTTLFRPGSISKTLTWTAIMQLEAQGLLALDEDIRTYLGDLPLTTNHDTPITLLDLMNHRPGFEDSALGHLFTKDAASVLPLADYLARYQPAQVNAPGEVSAYSNFGSGLAGLIVANVSGMPFEDYVDANITGPLRMTRTTFSSSVIKLSLF